VVDHVTIATLGIAVLNVGVAVIVHAIAPVPAAPALPAVPLAPPLLAAPPEPNEPPPGVLPLPSPKPPPSRPPVALLFVEPHPISATTTSPIPFRTRSMFPGQ
jgi:hypothetical protein